MRFFINSLLLLCIFLASYSHFAVQNVDGFYVDVKNSSIENQKSTVRLESAVDGKEKSPQYYRSEREDREDIFHIPYFDSSSNGASARFTPSGGVCTDTPVNVKYGEVMEVSVEVNPGEKRSFLMYVPSSYKSKSKKVKTKEHYTPVALQLQFHGLNDNCDNFIHATGFLPYAEKSDFVVVSACGSLGVLGTGWNSGTCCGFFSDDKPNEVLFVQKIFEVLTNQFKLCIHEDKVFTIGLSNGAMMAEILGCHFPYHIRFAASVAGVVELRPGNAAGLNKCDELVKQADEAQGSNHTSPRKKRTSVLMIHGDSDVMVPWKGSSILGFPSAEENLLGWRDRNLCPTTVTNTINNTYYENFVYEQCAPLENVKSNRTGFDRMSKEEYGQTIVELVKVKGGSHGWPEANGFSTTEYIMDFARRVFVNFLEEKEEKNS